MVWGEKKYKCHILVSCKNFIVGRGDDIPVYLLWGIHAAVTVLLIYGNGYMMNSKLLHQALLSIANNHLLSAKIVILDLHLIVILDLHFIEAIHQAEVKGIFLIQTLCLFKTRHNMNLTKF